MPMPPYPVRCYGVGCNDIADYKIAAIWSDGITHELKTYALSCERCLACQYETSKVKQAACRLAPGERLDVPGIYALTRGRRDRQLERRLDQEQQFRSLPIDAGSSHS